MILRDSISIVFLIAALKNFSIVSCNIKNTYLVTPCRKKFYYGADSEFRSDENKIYNVRRNLYALKTSWSSSSRFLAESFRGMGFSLAPGLTPMYSLDLKLSLVILSVTNTSLHIFIIYCLYHMTLKWAWKNDFQLRMLN